MADLPTEGVDIDAELLRFEQLVDKSDPEQMVLLEKMRADTKHIHRSRGDWEKPSLEGCWNKPYPTETSSKPPLDNESFREYKAHISKEMALEQLEGGGRGAGEGGAQAPAALPPAPPPAALGNGP